jgi:hypothetical protein
VVNSGFAGLLWTPEVRQCTSAEELLRRMQAVVFSPMSQINAWMIPNAPWKQFAYEKNMNNELLEDEKFIAQRLAGDLAFSLDDLLASVALNMHCRIRDMYGMSILEFEMARRAIDRGKKHLICGIAENSGTKWKGGNPYPSWCYDRKKAESATLTHISKYEGIAQKD